MERATGVEPASEAWEASVLPMNYARASLKDGPSLAEDHTRLASRDAPRVGLNPYACRHEYPGH